MDLSINEDALAVEKADALQVCEKAVANTLYKLGEDISAFDETAFLADVDAYKATKDIVSKLRKDYSKNITDEEQLKQIATISANNDTEVGELISTAMDKVGTDGVVTIEESKTGESYLETVEGMQFNRGYKSPYFVTDNSSMQAVLQDPLILVTDQRLQACLLYTSPSPRD